MVEPQVDDPRAALDAHFDAVAGEVLREMGARLWRAREAACAALADLVQARGCCACADPKISP